jgi:hypothetical protein
VDYLNTLDIRPATDYVVYMGTNHQPRDTKESGMKIITDHKWKQFKYRHEVPQKILDSEFDYHDDDDVSDGFFCYRGAWYHLDQFMGLPPDSSLGNTWPGSHGDSFFSAVLIELSDDGEEYRVGLALS